MTCKRHLDISTSFWCAARWLNNSCIYLWHITTDCDSIELHYICCLQKACRVSFVFSYSSCRLSLPSVPSRVQNSFFRLHMLSCVSFRAAPIPSLSVALRVKACNGTRGSSILYKHFFRLILYSAVYFLKWQNTQHFSLAFIISFSHSSANSWQSVDSSSAVSEFYCSSFCL